MLHISGKVLLVEQETITGPSGSFVATTVHLLTGKATVERVRVGRDFPPSAVPSEGDEFAAHVVVSAFATRSGAGYRLTALEPAQAGGGLRTAKAAG